MLNSSAHWSGLRLSSILLLIIEKRVLAHNFFPHFIALLQPHNGLAIWIISLLLLASIGLHFSFCSCSLLPPAFLWDFWRVCWSQYRAYYVSQIFALNPLLFLHWNDRSVCHQLLYALPSEVSWEISSFPFQYFSISGCE